MSETGDTEEKRSGASGRKPLSLKRTVDAGTVRQNFSHGRSKTVVVEKKRRRTITPKEKAKNEAAETAAVEAKLEKTPPVESPVATASAVERQGVVLDSLTEEERVARSRALSHARVAEVEERAVAVEKAKLREEEEMQKAALETKVQKKEADKIALQAKKDEERQKAEEEAALQQEAEEAKKEKTGGREKSTAGKQQTREDQPRKPISARKGERRRREGKLTISKALFEDEDRVRSLASMRRAREREKRAAQSRIGEQTKVFREVVIPEAITVEELAGRMAERVVDVIRKLIDSGHTLGRDDFVDADTAQLIAEEFGHEVKRVAESDVEVGLSGEEDREEDLEPRAPIVTVMGHVDHGKTSLLDALRATDVAAREAGGITQHIGAYQVNLTSGAQITFIDTPGHAAFTAMRARGAAVTDLVILVVAADDGVMPQTVEAIDHAKAAQVPIIVAINKIDLPDANPDRVRQDLLQYEVVSEKMGGDVLDIEVSALEKTNLDKLEEAVLLQAELLELKANPNRKADGTVIEAKLDKGRGPVATVLVRRGTLRVGDIVVAGQQWGKVRALINYRGDKVDEVGSSVPVEVLGLTGVPEPGNDFAVVDNEAKAREVTEYRARRAKDTQAVAGGPTTLEQMMLQLQESKIQELPILIKADVQGSLEAIKGALENLSTDEVTARMIHLGVGGITESDVILAASSNAFIIGFNVRANKQAREHATKDGVDIRYYSIIYNVIDDLKAALSGLLSPEIRETFLGNAEILEVFNVSKVGRVAGCRLTEGKVRRGSKVRLIRDNVVIHEGELSTLKRFKDEVKEVDGGQECGMAFANYQDIQVGDVIECFEVEEIVRSL